MKRRDFIAFLGGAAAWPVAASARQSAPRVIGYLDTGPPEGISSELSAVRGGLNDAGYMEGRNVTIVSPRGNGRLCRALSALALLSVLTAQIGAAPSAAAQNVTFQTFRCGDGTEFVAAFFKGTRAAYVQLDGKKMTLRRRLLSVSGKRYSAGGVTLRINANTTTLSRGGRSTDCSEV